ncbi:phosphotransferase [bacterium]|nr:phosphotransferase [bacterium]
MNNDQIDWLRQRFAFSKHDKLPVYGSQREFYRLYGESETRVAIIDSDLNQMTKFVDIAKLFRRLNVNIPVIYEYCFNRNILIEEDLGDDSLDRILPQTDDRFALYKQIINKLLEWQKLFDSSPDLAEDYDLPEYDFDFARNETVLFTERYLERYCGWSKSKTAELMLYFNELAERASKIRKTLMHRDFQSQNILWHRSKPHFVDFQTAVLGPYTYDLASLLFDNYVDLSVDEKEELIDYFYRSYPDENREDFYVAALQRTFQATSASAYLSREQGKTQYEKYIPKGLWHMELLAERFDWIEEKVLEQIAR